MSINPHNRILLPYFKGFKNEEMKIHEVLVLKINFIIDIYYF